MASPFALLQTTLTDACGTDPGFLCELVFDTTESEALTEAADFLVRPVKVILIFFLAWIVNRIVRRLIDRAVAEIAQSHDDKAALAESQDVAEQPHGRMEALRELAAKRALRATEKAERGRQRTETLGSVLRSVAALVI